MGKNLKKLSRALIFLDILSGVLPKLAVKNLLPTREQTIQAKKRSIQTKIYLTTARCLLKPHVGQGLPRRELDKGSLLTIEVWHISCGYLDGKGYPEDRMTSPLDLYTDKLIYQSIISIGSQGLFPDVIANTII